MDDFKQIIDTYLFNYEKYDNGKINFECKYGELIFIKNNNNFLTLFGIYIFPEYRQKGLCRNILYYLIENSCNVNSSNVNSSNVNSCKFKYLCIESVMSKILYNYLLRFKYKNKQFKLSKNGSFYFLT
jgi:hypothetical protein